MQKNMDTILYRGIGVLSAIQRAFENCILRNKRRCQMAQYDKDEKKIRYIGVSVHGAGKSRELKLHATNGKKNAAGNDQFVIWMELPGPVTYGFAEKLPRIMSKLEGVAFVLKNKRFGHGVVPGLSTAEIRNFLQERLTKMQAQVAIASSGRKPGRPRKVITAKRRTTRTAHVPLKKAA
jgi:hypothetical protein